MNILVGADFVPTRSNIDLFVKGDTESLFGADLAKLLHEADYRIFNLETPLTDVKNPILKCGPNLIAPVCSINGYLTAKADLLTVANNHIYDQGEQGLFMTLKTLTENHISYVGAGKNLEEASKPFVFSSDSKRVGVFACVEHEFSIAGENRSGANPFDPLESFDNVKHLKEKCDYLIVLYHGGNELYRYPSPMLQRICRKFISSGADVVICQHSHCVGCMEEYESGSIIYGQGNFLFDQSENEYWKTGLLIRLEDVKKISFIPLVKRGNTVRIATDEEAKEILNGFMNRSRAIQQPGFIKSEYRKLAEQKLPIYMNSLGGTFRSGLNRVKQKLFHKSINVANLYGKKRIAEIINTIDDETHRELVLEGLKSLKH